MNALPRLPHVYTRLRELVSMRIGWATGSDYEWTQHWSIAQERSGATRTSIARWQRYGRWRVKASSRSGRRVTRGVGGSR